MALELNGTTGVSLVQDGVVTAADLASDAITSAALPAGSVLQVVQDTYLSQVTTTAGNTTYVDTNLSASITPSSTSNKVLALVTHSNSRKVGDNVLNVRLLRDSTAIISSIGNLDTGDTQLLTDVFSFSYLDSPNTTSQVTYKTQFASANGVIYGPNVIILMEIAG